MNEMQILIDTGVDLKNKMFSIIGVVDEDLYEHVYTAIHMLNTYESKVEGYDEKPVTIMLSTYGGDLFYGFGIYDLLKELGVNTRIICNGPVMSAGSVILQAGTERIMMPHSTILVHFGSQTAESTKDKHQFDVMLKKSKAIIKLRAKVIDKTINKWFTVESYFDANRAIHAGLIDGVYNGKKD